MHGKVCASTPKSIGGESPRKTWIPCDKRQRKMIEDRKPKSNKETEANQKKNRNFRSKHGGEVGRNDKNEEAGEKEMKRKGEKTQEQKTKTQEYARS